MEEDTYGSMCTVYSENREKKAEETIVIIFQD